MTGAEKGAELDRARSSVSTALVRAQKQMKLRRNTAAFLPQVHITTATVGRLDTSTSPGGLKSTGSGKFIERVFTRWSVESQFCGLLPMFANRTQSISLNLGA